MTPFKTGLEEAAVFIEQNELVHTSDGEQTRARSDGNRAGLGYATAIRALASLSPERPDGAGAACERCHGPATHRADFPTGSNYLCDGCIQASEGETDEVFEHEMREFGGAYGLPARPTYVRLATPPATPVQPTASVEGVRAALLEARAYVPPRDGIVGRIDAALASLTPAPTQGDEDRLLRQLRSLAVALHSKHYSNDAPNWQPLEDAEGLLSQIDNMTTGLSRTPAPVSAPATDGEVVEALRAIAEGYPVQVQDDRFIVVENPHFQPDNGSNPKLVIDVAALSNAPGHGEGGACGVGTRSGYQDEAHREWCSCKPI